MVRTFVRFVFWTVVILGACLVVELAGQFIINNF